MERPPPKQIDEWIAGTLPADLAVEVEAWFENHPEELPTDLPGKGPRLSEIEALVPLSPLEEATVSPEDPNLTSLIAALKARPFTNPPASEDPLGDEGWLDFLTPTSEPGLIGTLDHYEVVEVIATTGMGTVFKARDPNLNRFAALKVLSPALATNHTARRRFLREAKSMARLEHPNILPIYSVHNDTVPWFAMRFIEGGSLQEALDSNRPDLATPAFIQSLARQLAGALETAHLAGTIHRDIKPANVLLAASSENDTSEECRIWLTDFGIARTIEDPGLTYGDAVPGTPRYMSPEQAEGGTIDRRTDFFSLGSILYHLAAGRPPFEGSNSTVILNKVARSQPSSLTRLNPNLPPWLSFFIHRLLEKEPTSRPENLLTALDHQRAPGRPFSWKIPAATLAILSLILGAIFLFNHNTNPPEKTTPPTVPTGTFIRSSSGKTFATLTEAISTAPSGTELILNGNFTLTAPIESLPNSALTLRAAAPGSATIMMDFDDYQGISIHGDLIANGIHFIRETNARQAETLTAINASRIELADCRFTSSNRIPGTLVYGLTSRGTATITARRCAFHGSRFYSFNLRESSNGAQPPEVNLTLQECFLQGSTGIFFRLGFHRPKLQLSFDQTVMEGKRFLRFASNHSLGHTQVKLTDCLLDCSAQNILVEAAPLETITEYFQWTGLRTHDASGGSLLSLYPASRNFSKITQLQKIVPRFTETAPWKGRVFNQGQLNSEISAPIRKIYEELGPQTK